MQITAVATLPVGDNQYVCMCDFFGIWILFSNYSMCVRM